MIDMEPDICAYKSSTMLTILNIKGETSTVQ